jgi:modification methylase
LTIATATHQSAPRHGTIITADATHLPDLLPPHIAGQVALVLTSPPYGPRTHGLIQTYPDHSLAKTHHRYGRPSHGNLAYQGWQRLLDGFTQIMTTCRTMLRPGSIAVITTRPVRRHRDDLIDLPTRIHAAAIAAGLQPLERCVALLAAVRDDHLIHRASTFAILTARRTRTEGIPVSVITHEDVLVLKRP